MSAWYLERRAYNDGMSDRILDTSREENPFTISKQSPDFWDQYFDLQKLTTAVDMANGRFSLRIVNQNTGETHKVESVRLSALDGFKIH